MVYNFSQALGKASSELLVVVVVVVVGGGMLQWLARQEFYL